MLNRMDVALKSNSVRLIPLAIILLIAIFIRIPMLPRIAYLVDAIYFRTWAEHANQSGLFSVYQEYNGDYANHPPLSIALFAASTRIYQALGGGIEAPQGIDPIEANVGYRIVLKMIPLVFDILLICATYAITLARSTIKWATFITAVIAFHPALVYDSVWWGQTDVVLTFFLVLSVYSLARNRIYLAWILYAFALLTKFQAIPLLPLLLVLTWRRTSFKILFRSVGLMVTIWLAVLLPFIFGSGLKPALIPYVGATQYPIITAHAHNFWYYAFAPQYNLDSSKLTDIPRDAVVPKDDSNATVIYIGPLNARTVGFILFGSAVLIVVVRVWLYPHEQNEFWLAALLFLCFYMFLTEMHERYFYPGLVLLILSLRSRDLKSLFALGLSITCTFTILSIGDHTNSVFEWIYGLMPWQGIWVAFANIVMCVLMIGTVGLPILFKHQLKSKPSTLVT